MRRMFQGRMISVDGCGKRMQANWNEFAINKDNDHGYSLLQVQIQMPENEEIVIADSDIRNGVVFKCNPNTTYNIKCSKTGYECIASGVDNDNIVVIKSSWGNSISLTTTADTVNLAIGLAVGSAHTAPITVGDCGIIITKY